MQYSSSVNAVSILLHVSGLLVARPQEVTMYICDNGMCCTSLSNPTWPADSRLRRTTRTNCRIFTLLPPDDGLLASPKHAEVKWLHKLKINSATSWFHYTLISRCTVNETSNSAEKFFGIFLSFNIVGMCLWWGYVNLKCEDSDRVARSGSLSNV
jgi:hypothetical protein